MILLHEQDLQKDISFSFSEGSNCGGKNEFISQFSCLQSHLYLKIHELLTYISTRK